jgi:biotin carboxylase
MTQKTLLIVAGGIEAVPGIRRAKEMEIHVVVSDGNPDAPGFALADDRLLASTYDIDGTVDAARRYHETVRPIDGVMCIASDVPLTVASVAEALGLPGIPVATAHLATDKLAMKHRFEDCGVPIPWFAPVASPADLKRLVKQRGLPLVLKPVDSRGARGVLRLTPGVDLDWAYAASRKHSPTGRVMLEQFLAGPQVSTESLVLDGTAVTPGFADRNYEYLDRYAPYMIENGGELPSALPEPTQQAVRELVQQAATCLGVRNGSLKGDIVVFEIPLNTGVDFVGQAIRLALGERVQPQDLEPRFQRPVAQRYLFPKPGRVVSVTDAGPIAARPGIALCEVRVAPGGVIGEVDSHPARAGVVLATGDTPAEALQRAVAAVEAIKIETVA